MDLLATVFESGALTCSRLLSLQKVWYRAPCGRVISIAWRPDGRVLAIGTYNEKTKENICTLHDVEDGKEIYSINKDAEITAIAWFDCDDIDKQNLQEDPLRGKKIPEIPEVQAENFSHRLALKQTKMNLLLISTTDGIISLYALGLFHLSDVSIHDEPNTLITQTHMSSCMRFISFIVLDETSSSNSHYSLRMIRLDTLQNRKKEILNVAKMYAKITDELEYLDDTLSAITTSWTDVLAGLDNKLSSYCSRKNKKSDDSQDGDYTFISADDLLQLLVLGYPSDNLEKFLADMSDKGLRKLNMAIEQTCLRVQNLIVKNAQKCCYHLHSDLNRLRGMSLWREKYADVGLDDKSIVEAMRDVGSLVLKLTELQQVIDHSLKSTKSFFRWLISVAARLCAENGDTTTHVNRMTQQDIQLITDFILENFDYNSNHDDLGSFLSRESDFSSANNSDSWSNRPTCSNFTLEQVGQYLKNEPLTRLKYSFMKPESNFWINFFRSRPDISEPKILEEDGSSMILFYPHRSSTSLIQEHKQACNSIKAAFKSVVSSINLIPESGMNFVHLRNFLKNGPAKRIRLETDIRVMKQYTLFQTKESPVAKQYVIAQSLNDKSFRLISLEFQSSNPAATSTRQTTNTRLSGSLSAGASIVIGDSNFYDNKDSKRMLLCFLLLDQINNDTILVQVEVEKLFTISGCPERAQKDGAKVFRNNDMIEKHSCQLLLKIDLHTEPAADRKHEPEMMVKRIRRVLGLDLYTSSSRGVIAFTSNGRKRLHLYELESAASESEIVDDEVDAEEEIDESLIDTDLLG